MMDDLFRPVPAAGAPAFCTKKTSSVGGYLFFELASQVFIASILCSSFLRTKSRPHERAGPIPKMRAMSTTDHFL